MPTSFFTARTRALLGAVAAAALLLGMIGSAPAQARATLAAPTGLTPDAVTVDSIPVLTWDRDDAATGYRVEMSLSPTFDTTIFTVNTTNHQTVPTKQLPMSTIYWRVQASASSVVSPWSTAVIERSALAGPTPVTPEDGTVLKLPQEPVLLTWAPVTGAKEYVAEVSTDSTFADDALKDSYTQKTTSLVIPDPRVAQTYYWRVRATLDTGIYSMWSETRSYEIGGLAKPVLTGPDDSPFTDVEDIVLDWEPVLGAKTYNLQMSTDHNFADNNLDVNITGVTGTAYSPPITKANDQYYWRVQPVDFAGNKLDWADVDIWTFRRHWPDQPALQYPDQGETIGQPLYFQWSPVHLASRYMLQVSGTSTFDTYVTKTTVHTNYIPTSKWLPSSAGGTYYWRVIAIDDPGSTRDGDDIVTDAISAEVRSFNYDPQRASLVSPTPGETLEIPTLRWQPVSGAYSYLVTITHVSDAGTGDGAFTTYGTSFTPRSLLTPGATYRWDVQTKSASGELGSSLLPGGQRTFTVADSTQVDGATPEPLESPEPSTRFPTLSWTKVTDATRYRIRVRPAGSTGWSYLPDYFVYTSGEDDLATYLNAGTYEWAVEAYQGSNYISESSTSSTFEILPLDALSGLRLALTPVAVESPATSCETVLPERCMDLRQTPVLAWDPVPDASLYKVYLARDEEMTNLVLPSPLSTENTRFIWPDQLVDSQAGSAFYWLVVPCKSPSSCSPLTHATHAFNKLSKPVEPLTPANSAIQANDVTLTWRDYLETNQDPSAFPSDEPTGVNDVDATVEAQQYRVQLSTDANFGSPFITKTVDQTTFTSFDNTLPEGPIWWRVQAIDGTGNFLKWSDPMTFTKNSPTVTLTEPTNQMHASGSVPLRWEPLPFAASYDVEVYRNAIADNQITQAEQKQLDEAEQEVLAKRRRLRGGAGVELGERLAFRHRLGEPTRSASFVCHL